MRVAPGPARCIPRDPGLRLTNKIKKTTAVSDLGSHSACSHFLFLLLLFLVVRILELALGSEPSLLRHVPVMHSRNCHLERRDLDTEKLEIFLGGFGTLLGLVELGLQQLLGFVEGIGDHDVRSQPEIHVVDLGRPDLGFGVQRVLQTERGLDLVRRTFRRTAVVQVVLIIILPCVAVGLLVRNVLPLLLEELDHLQSPLHLRQLFPQAGSSPLDVLLHKGVFRHHLLEPGQCGFDVVDRFDVVGHVGHEGEDGDPPRVGGCGFHGGRENVRGRERGTERKFAVSLSCSFFFFWDDQDMRRKAAIQFYNVARSVCPVCGIVNFSGINKARTELM